MSDPTDEQKEWAGDPDGKARLEHYLRHNIEIRREGMKNRAQLDELKAQSLLERKEEAMRRLDMALKQIPAHRKTNPTSPPDTAGN